MLAQAGIRDIVRGRLTPRKLKRGLRGLVNNAGIYQPRTLMETETELFERRTRVNQLGCLRSPSPVADTALYQKRLARTRTRSQSTAQPKGRQLD